MTEGAAIGPLDVKRVMAALPHRYPMLLVDRVESIEPDHKIVAIKAVTINEGFFQGHFPGRPIMPGVLILEAMAQAAGILVFRSRGSKPEKNSVYYYVGIDEARFKKPVVPGDQLEVEVIYERELRRIFKFKCAARVAGEVVAEATILCAVQTDNEK